MQINIEDYLDRSEIVDAARYAVRQHFSDEFKRSDAPYKIMYEAIKAEGVQFDESIRAKLKAFDEDSSVYYVTSSDEFKMAVSTTLKEHSAFLAAAIAKKIEEMDSYDLQQAIGEAIINFIKAGSK